MLLKGPRTSHGLTLIWLFLVALITCFMLLTIVDGRKMDRRKHPTTAIPPTTSTAYLFPTIAPGKKVNFTVKLAYSGPACLDSKMVFKASLHDNQGHSVQSKYFHYVWMNSANYTVESTKGQYEASVVKTFSSGDTRPGQYLMTVKVYGDATRKIFITSATINFILTENLNGNFTINQTLPYQRNKTVFAKSEPIQLNLNIHDKFDNRAQIYYFWNNNGTLIGTSTKPRYKFKINKEGNYTIQAEAHVGFSGQLKALPGDSSCKLNFSSAPADKCGKFIQKIQVKEKLRVLNIEGGTSVPIGGAAILNISCIGSSPTGVCFNVTLLNRTHMNDNVTCAPQNFANSGCFHQIKVWPKKRGWHDIGLAVYNDVSFMHGNYFVYAYNPDSSGSSMVTIPIVFSLLAVIIIAIGGTYLWKMRKKPYIEVADFEFHPSIERSGSYVVFSDILEHLKRFLKRKPTRFSVQCDSVQPDSSAGNRASLYDSL